MNKKNLSLIMLFSLILVIILLPKTTYAETTEKLEINMDDTNLIASKNIGCSIKKPNRTAEEFKVQPKSHKKVEPIETEKKSTQIEFTNSQLITSKIPMPIDHQEYLYKLCEERGLDYTLMLSLIKQESGFTANRISKTNDYGYMQINIVNHKNLVKELKTPNTPLDPYTNMNWGTHMMAKLNNKYKNQGYSGEKLNRAVLSAYNKGEGGYKRTGEATTYINKVNKEHKWVKKTIGK